MKAARMKAAQIRVRDGYRRRGNLHPPSVFIMRWDRAGKTAFVCLCVFCSRERLFGYYIYPE